MLSFLSYQNFSPSHNFEQHRKPVCTNHCVASKENAKATFSNSTSLKQKDTKTLTSVLIVGGKVRCKKWAKLKEIPNCLVTVRLMCFTNGHIFATDQTLLQHYTHTWFSESCFWHWELCTGKIMFGGHSSISLQCVPYAQIPNCQCPIAKSTFIELGRYVVVNLLSQVIFVCLLFLGMVMYANEVGTKVKKKYLR